MKYRINLILLFILTAFAFSCEKHVIEYDSVSAASQAQFQLHYFVPLTTGAANNISKVELNGEWINRGAPLATYNAIPSGDIGRFYTTKPGVNNIKLYKGDNMELVYDQDVELTATKQNVFVYDFSKKPIVIDNGAPFTGNITAATDSSSWVKFYNFLFESAGVPTSMKLQYQYQYTVNYPLNIKSEWINVGSPVSFGEATDWFMVKVNKNVIAQAGTERLDYRIVVTNGANPGELLQVRNASGATVNYADWWNATIGRRVHHIFSGIRTAAPLSAVRTFTAL